MSFTSFGLSATTPFDLSLPKGLVARYHSLSLRYRRPAVSVPLRELVSPAYRRVRRVSPRQGESLSFVASNESNQSKDAEHQLICHSCVATRVRPVHAMLKTSRTHAAISSPHASLRIGSIAHDAKRVGTGKVAKQQPHCSWAPWEASRSAGVWGRARKRAS